MTPICYVFLVKTDKELSSKTERYYSLGMTNNSIEPQSLWHVTLLLFLNNIKHISNISNCELDKHTDGSSCHKGPCRLINPLCTPPDMLLGLYNISLLTISLPLLSELLTCKQHREESWSGWKFISTWDSKYVCIIACICKRLCYSQDIFYLCDDVFSIRALSLQSDTVSDSLLVQSCQFSFSHCEAHTALLPTCDNRRLIMPQEKNT